MPPHIFREKSMSNPRVAIAMGSDSDWPTMKPAAEILDSLGISNKPMVLSAHRMPTEMVTFAQGAREQGFDVIIAGAGGAAHLPGMIASLTTLPVIGVPVAVGTLDGMDSLLSIVQMPAGIPVATVAIGNAKNAGLLAARILGVSDLAIAQTLSDYSVELNAAAKARGENLK
jgi:5-(carboxyamino)imidazole ribonucleotide mutase